MDGPSKLSPRANFRQFFVRGLAIVLPTVLTIWILVAGYQFVQGYIAQPINERVKQLMVHVSPWPVVLEQDLHDELREIEDDRTPQGREARAAYAASADGREWLRLQAKKQKVDTLWSQYALPLDLIGLVLAIILIYMVGLVLGSFIGRRLYNRGEEFVQRLPLVRRVYPAVKQVTDFFVGDKTEGLRFSKVVAVQYPRKGLWSIGLVTGETMQVIQDAAGEDCLTVFVPSSPTPFTGYVITVPRADTVDLPISIEDAMKFTVSGGVLIPPGQKISGEKISPMSPKRGGEIAGAAPAALSDDAQLSRESDAGPAASQTRMI